MRRGRSLARRGSVPGVRLFYLSGALAAVAFPAAVARTRAVGEALPASTAREPLAAAPHTTQTPLLLTACHTIVTCHVARVESAQALDNLREGRTRRWDREARTYVHRSIRPRTRIARAPRSGRGRCIRRRTAHPRSCRLHSPHRRHTRPRDRSGRGRSRRWWRSRPHQRGRPSASSPPPQTRRRKRTARRLSNRGHVRCIHAGTGGRGRRIRRPRSRRRTHRRPTDQCTTRGRYTRADTSMQSSRHPSNSERKRTRQPGRIHGRGGRRSRRRRSIGLPGPRRPAERSPRSIEGPVSILVDRAPSDRARA